MEVLRPRGTVTKEEQVHKDRNVGPYCGINF